MAHFTTRFIRRMTHQLGLRRDWHLVVIAVFIGLLMALVATMVHWTAAHGRKTGRISSPGTLVLGTHPVRSIHRWSSRRYLSLGHSCEPYRPGISTVIYSVRRKRGKINWRLGVQQWINSSLSIATGGSAGAEGPIASIGGVMGSNAGQLMHANTQSTTTLLGCGAAAGISAVFNAPIAGIFFVMEILLRDFSMRTFTPIVISSVVAAAATQGILHDEAIFDLGSVFADHEGHFHISLLPLYLLLGILCGLGALAFIRGLSLSGTFFERLKIPYLLKPALGGLMLGVLGLEPFSSPVLKEFLISMATAIPSSRTFSSPVPMSLLKPAISWMVRDCWLLSFWRPSH